MEASFLSSVIHHKRARLALVALGAFALILYLFSPSTQSHPNAHGPYAVSSSRERSPTSFHHIIPATRSNKNLCRLLLSGTALNFPSPVFINWGAKEDPDPYKVHMQKVNSILAYLDTFAPDRHDDLVFILDGYDIWLQLPPDVIIKRYYEIIDAGNERLRQRMGASVMEKHNIYQSIVFGPDKICWPENPKRFACWAVADSTLPRWAFGPETDSGKWRHLNRPRWLNSGTIIGPLGDVRDLFQATLDLISTNYTVDSDQFYFSNIFGIQEYARSKAAGDLPKDMMQYRWHIDGWGGEGHMEWIKLNEPYVVPENRTEYHVTIDYESKLFQTVAYYNNFLTWTQYDGDHSKDSAAQRFLHSGGALDEINPALPDDILSATPPFQIPGLDSTRDLNESVPAPPSHLKWSDLSLGMNIASQHIFAAIHFTPPKYWRDVWWNRMWFAPYAETIIRNAKPTFDEPYLTTRDGREWWPYVRDDSEDLPLGKARAGGGYADKGNWLGWDLLCGKHEDAVFHNTLQKGERPYPDYRPMPKTEEEIQREKEEEEARQREKEEEEKEAAEDQSSEEGGEDEEGDKAPVHTHKHPNRPQDGSGPAVWPPAAAEED
ncbi:hypothetical protein FH972_021606 [Carpinus fangiana]|uniref:Uncharacterized protein n=1 Tax=Carpinus fangiana TaxID=176857 RepID=A0A5N6KQE6_9ROSI|nr:hypothetical protein FH972_021606 [Carpinus fangiana]